jgi:hypothetical protein
MVGSRNPSPKCSSKIVQVCLDMQPFNVLSNANDKSGQVLLVKNYLALFNCSHNNLIAQELSTEFGVV